MIIRHLKLFIFFIGLFSFLQSHSQYTGEWLDAKLEIGLQDKLSLKTSLALRVLNDEGLQVRNVFTELGLRYEVNEHLAIEPIFRLIDGLEDDLRYHPRYMGIIDFYYTRSVQSWELKYKGRLQNITKSYIDNETDRKQTAHLRNRFSLAYSIPDVRIIPGGYIEVFTPLYRSENALIDELRFAADIEVPIKDNQSLTPRIIYLYRQFDYEISGLVLQIIYKYSIGKSNY